MNQTGTPQVSSREKHGVRCLRSIEKRDFELVLSRDKALYPTQQTVSPEVLAMWFERYPDFGMIYEIDNDNDEDEDEITRNEMTPPQLPSTLKQHQQHQNIFGTIAAMCIVVPLSTEGFHSLIRGQISEAECTGQRHLFHYNPRPKKPRRRQQHQSLCDSIASSSSFSSSSSSSSSSTNDPNDDDDDDDDDDDSSDFVEIGLHVYHMEKFSDQIPHFHTRILTDLNNILVSKFPMATVIGLSALCVSNLGINLFYNKLNCLERDYICNEHIVMLQDHQQRLSVVHLKSASDLQHLCDENHTTLRYLNRCKMLVTFPGEPSLVWVFFKRWRPPSQQQQQQSSSS